MENKHSIKVAQLFATHAGFKMLKWNLQMWTPHNESTVGFVISKPNFKGAVNVVDIGGGLFQVLFQDVKWEPEMVAQTVLDAKEMVEFIDKLGNESEKAQGHRAPKDSDLPMAALGMSAN